MLARDASMPRALLGIVLAAIVTSTSAIYPADHFQFSLGLTTTNHEGFIKAEVDAGKTLFVRWIASEG